MKYRQVGSSLLTVSAVGLGCNNFGGERSSELVPAYGAMDLEDTTEVVRAALDCGVTLFDTANVYGRGGSERFLGKILHTVRGEVVIATKWGSGEASDVAWGSRRYIRLAVEGSLGRLGTDYIDLFQLHWPDPRTPIEETLAALHELIDEGKVRYIGCSHFSGVEILDADKTARSQGLTRMVSVQNHYNLLERSVELDVVPACAQLGVGLLPYFPLASGLLTGKYERKRPAPRGTRLEGRDFDDRTYDLLEDLRVFAREHNRSMVDLAIGGLLAEPVVASVITGATTPQQIRVNAAATEQTLPPALVAALRTIVDR